MPKPRAVKLIDLDIFVPPIESNTKLTVGFIAALPSKLLLFVTLNPLLGDMIYEFGTFNTAKVLEEYFVKVVSSVFADIVGETPIPLPLTTVIPVPDIIEFT